MRNWDNAYQSTPPWEIGRPQNVFIRLEREGALIGSILDIGCGTGENALHLAARGHDVWGVDVAPSAIRRAQIKAHARQLPAVFLVADITQPELLGRRFNTAIDSGCYHAMSDNAQYRYAASLERLLVPGGRLHVLGFSDEEPGTAGPRRLRENDFREVFTDQWDIENLARDRYETLHHAHGAKAWLATIRLRPE
jgi:SAM-dependent methyltransferase